MTRRTSFGSLNMVVIAVFLTLLLVVIFHYEINKKAQMIPDDPDADFRNIHELIKKEGLAYKLCVMEKLGKGVKNKEIFWTTLQPAVEACTVSSQFQHLPISSYDNMDETKYYLHDKNMDTQKSVIVTLGVGKDVIVEKHLKEILANDTEFFAADPMLENDAIFTPIGYFYPFAVGKTTGLANASVLTEGFSVYNTLEMMHIDTMSFMTRIIRRNIIDQFLLDNEGPEYDIQPLMATGAEFDKAGITVCQINAEYHGGHLSELHTVLIDLFEDNRFIPLRIVQATHVRLFMINIQSPYCVKRYLMEHFDK